MYKLSKSVTFLAGLMILGTSSIALAANPVTWNFSLETSGADAHWNSDSAGQPRCDNGTSFNYVYNITSAEAKPPILDWIDILDKIPADKKTGGGDKDGSLPIALYNDTFSETQSNSSATVTISIDGNGTGLADFTNVHLGSYSGIDIKGLRIGGTVTVTAYYNLAATVTGGHGTIDPSGATKDLSGKQVTLTATPENGYIVKAWTGTDDNTSTATTNTVTLDSDKTVTVEFELYNGPTHTLSTSVVTGADGVGGTIDPAGDTQQPENRLATVTAHPDAGYRVKAWTGTSDDTLKTNSNTVMMDDDKTVSVEFELIPTITHNLTRTVTPGTDGQPHGTLIVPGERTKFPEGTVVTLTAHPETGYRVKAWTGTDNDNVKTLTNDVTMNTDKAVTVEFEVAPIHTLTTKVIGGHGTIDPLGDSPEYEDTVVTLTAFPLEGYTVKAWVGTDKDTLTTNTNTIKITSDTTVTVEFAPVPGTTYTLNIKLLNDFGMVTPSGKNPFPIASRVDLMAKPIPGYRVKAWTGTDHDELVTNANAVTMTSDMTVTLEFEAIPSSSYTLTTTVVNPTCGTLSAAGSNPYLSGTAVALTATPIQGYRVKAWTGADVVPAAGSNNNTVTMTADKTVSVEFELIPSQDYTLTTSVVPDKSGNGHGTLEPAGANSYPAGTVVDLTAKPDAGYRVKKWTGTIDDTSTAATNKVTVDIHKTVTVEFEALPPNQYYLTTQLVNLHGSITPSGKHSFQEGTVVLLAVQADSGYRLKTWTGTDNDQSTLLNNTVTMTGDKTVTAEFEPLPPAPYSLTTVVAGGHGTIFPSGTLVYSGTTVVTLEAQADPGYGVKSWLGTDNDASVASINKVTVDGIKTVTVEFSPLGTLGNQLTTGVVGGNGKLWPLSGKFPSGTVVNLIATPNTGFKVKQWTGTDNDTSTAQTNKVTMSAAKSVTVEFEESLSAAPTQGADNQNSPTATPTTTPSDTATTSNGFCGSFGVSLMVAIVLAGLLLCTCKPD